MAEDLPAQVFDVKVAFALLDDLQDGLVGHVEGRREALDDLGQHRGVDRDVGRLDRVQLVQEAVDFFLEAFSVFSDLEGACVTDDYAGGRTRACSGRGRSQEPGTPWGL